MRSVVVFPQPAGPRSSNNWPCSIVIEIPSTARTSSNSLTTVSSRMSAGLPEAVVAVVSVLVSAAAIGVPPFFHCDLGFDVDVLRLLERLQAFLPELPAETGLLHAAERARVVVRQRVVEPDRAGLDLAHAAQDRVEVLRVDVAAEAEAGRVGELDRLVEALDRDERCNGAEGLLAQEVGFRRSSGDDRRRVEVAGAVRRSVAA